jgi:hypothetical protein
VWLNLADVGQLSFFSAEATPPAVTDLSGLLAGPGQTVSSAAGARISVVIDEPWRARAVAQLIDEAGLLVEIARSEEGRQLVRTGVVPELSTLAREWTRGAVKAVPPTWVPDARELRMWAVAAGYGENGGERFVLGLDPHAPDTHPQLALALMRAGIAPTLIGTRGPRPGLRIAGRRRLLRLMESIGDPPPDADPDLGWPRF